MGRSFPPRNGAVQRLILSLLACFLIQAKVWAISPLLQRGYTVLPEPQQVHLENADLSFGPEWRLQLAGVQPNSSAVEDLTETFRDRLGLHLDNSKNAPVLKLMIQADAVQPNAPSQDSNGSAIRLEAYRLELRPSRVEIVANAEAGLYYGVQTLKQLLKQQNGVWLLPQGSIVDWPDLELRQIYWDDAHHLERPAELKRAVREASSFKINGFVIKLDGHFAYRSAPAAAEPQALSPDELQSLTNYGLRYHVQVIPYLDAPAHLSFLLKHPEYARYRAFPNSNYELCTVNPQAVELLKNMYSDLLAANKGVKYFYLSTDEAYYVGLPDSSQCPAATGAKQLGSRGKLLAQFISQTAGYLHDKGREVVFWGEYPLKPDDIGDLPAYLINGETYGRRFDSLYKSHGIRQMIYQPTEGEEQLFPHYFLLPRNRLLHPLQEDFERIREARNGIRNDTARQDADLIGVVVAGWADMGLHPETFWLGYATIAAAGWHRPMNEETAEEMGSFFTAWYGWSARNMGRIYQLMSYCAQTWFDTWDVTDSTARKPIFGNSERIFSPPEPVHDQTLPLPGVPDNNLQYDGAWTRENINRLRAMENNEAELDELSQLLNENLQVVHEHHGSLEVFLSVAQLFQQNRSFLSHLRQIDEALTEAAHLAAQGKEQNAIAALDKALRQAVTIKRERNETLRDVTEVWYRSWLPRTETANGRRFLHEMDDVKDHLPDRTIDMSYLVYRQSLLPFDKWFEQTIAARNSYATSHHLPIETDHLSWNDLRP